MNISKTQEISNNLNSYLQANSQYNPLVLRKALRQSDKFPLVTIVEQNNTLDTVTTRNKKQEFVSNLYYEINIYAVDIRTEDKTISNVVITDELKKLVDDVMSIYYGLKRTSCRPTPNVDSTIYRITMRYEGKIFENRNRLF